MDIPIDKPLVLVTWLDAKDGQTGWHSIDDIEKEKLATCYSVGWLMVRGSRSAFLSRSSFSLISLASRFIVIFIYCVHADIS